MSATIKSVEIGRSGSALSLDIEFECDWCFRTVLGGGALSIDHWLSDGYVPAPGLPEGWTVWPREVDEDHRSSTHIICERHEAVKLQNWRAGREDSKKQGGDNAPR